MIRPTIYVSGVSRSGTTLLCAALDAHPEIHMGYEMLAPRHLDLTRLVEGLTQLIDAGAAWPRQVGNGIGRDLGPEVGKFVKRTARTGATATSLVDALKDLPTDCRSVATSAGQVALAQHLVATHAADICSWIGFKAQGEYLHAGLAQSARHRAVAIVRDPRDVVSSQLRVGLADSATRAAQAWCDWVADIDTHPQVLLIRYEDLVAAPETTLQHVCVWLDIDFSRRMLTFEREGIGVLTPGQRHANDAMLRRGFSTERVNAWRFDGDVPVISTVADLCEDQMVRLGYRDAFVPGGLS